MKTILFVALGELHVTKGGIHRVSSILMNKLNALGYKCLYLISTFDCQFYYIDNREDLDHRIHKDQVKSYIIEKHVDVVIDQLGFCSNNFANLFNSFKLDNVSYITVFHNSPLIYEKTFTFKRSIYNFINQNGIKNHIANGLRILSFPLWKRHVIKGSGRLFKINYDIADKCVMLSKNEITELGRYIYYSNLTKCHCIPNPLSFEYIKDPSCLKNKKKRVLIVSRLNNFEKRIDLALKIWKKIEQNGYHDWHLDIVGEGIHENQLKNLALDLNLKNVSFWGRQPSEYYYERASIFIMTSAIEGWGLTLTESMQMGVVPIAFNTYPALKDIITDGYDGYIIKEGDIDGYAHKIMQLMDDTKLREQIAINGLESCHRFEINKVVSQWVKLIESL